MGGAFGNDNLLWSSGTVALAVAATSTASPPTIGDVNEDVMAIEVYSTSDAWLAIGAAPVAAAVAAGNSGASVFVPAGVVVTFPWTKGQKVAVIRATADGTMYVTKRRA